MIYVKLVSRLGLEILLILTITKPVDICENLGNGFSFSLDVADLLWPELLQIRDPLRAIWCFHLSSLPNGLHVTTPLCHPSVLHHPKFLDFAFRIVILFLLLS